ncbi:MAG: NACHT domain-containing protein, partial [Acidobacteriota bacterium]
MTVSQAHDDWYLATLEHALQSELYGGLRDLLIDLFTWHLRPSLERALAEARTAFVQSLAVSFMPDLRTEDRLRAVLDTPPFLQAVAGLIELSHDRIAIDDCRPTFAALDLPGANDVDLDAAWQALGRRFLQALQLSPTLRDLLPLSDADIFSPARESTLDALLGTVLPDPTSSRLRIDEDALLRYRTALQQRYSALPTSALFVSSPDGDGAPIALADVFTEIALVRDHERRKRRRAPEPGETTGGGAGGESGRVVDLFDLERPFAEARTLAEVLSSEDRVIVLLGAPGAGKSTLLQALVLSLCRPPDDVAPALELGVNADTVPIPVPLAAYAAARAADPSMRLRRFMVERHQAHLPQIQTLLASERALVLLDGYEAHRDPALDNSLGDEIWGLVTHHPRARFVLTARPGAYQEAPMPAMVSTWRLAPFDRARIGHFLRSWFRALARTGADLDLTAFPNAKADRLRDQVMSRPWLAQLAQNPLMATLLVLVARTQRRRLPEKRAAYHDEAVRALVHAWERAHEIRIAAYARATARGIASDAAHADGRAPATQDLPPAALLVRLMAHVAWRAAVDAGGQRAIPAAQLRTWLRERLDQEPTWQGDRGARGVDVLIDLAHRAPGLLRPDTAAADDAGAPSARATTYRFLHPILQDHLVAQHLLDVHDEAATQRWVRRHVHDSRWNPVLQLAIGGARQAQADGLLRAVLSAPTSVLEPRLHRDLRFVCRCLGEGADAGPELRAEVAQHLFTALIDDALLDWKGLARDAAGVGAVPEVMAVMVSKLTDPRLDVRLSAVAYFARIGTDDEAVRSTFEDLLADDDLGMRQAAVAYFARLGSVDEVTRRAFADRLCDGDPRIRQVAMAYFTHLGAEDDATRRVVRERLEDEDIHVRRAAASWMLRFGAAADDDLRAMASALDDDDATVRQRALAFLARRGGADRRTRARFAERLSARDVAE